MEISGEFESVLVVDNLMENLVWNWILLGAIEAKLFFDVSKRVFELLQAKKLIFKIQNELYYVKIVFFPENYLWNDFNRMKDFRPMQKALENIFFLSPIQS